jgi:hypothetical protein
LTEEMPVAGVMLLLLSFGVAKKTGPIQATPNPGVLGVTSALVATMARKERLVRNKGDVLVRES